MTSFRREIHELTGLSPAKCYQCGKCSAGCPMASEMPVKPHEIIRLVQLDRRHKVLADESIWLCLTCETCSARCPNGFDPAQLIDGLRELAERHPPLGAAKRIRAFHQAFLKQIRSHGRIYEIGLAKGFKLRGGPLLADVTAAPAMFLKGKLPLLPSRISGVEDIRRIFRACDEESAR